MFFNGLCLKNVRVALLERRNKSQKKEENNRKELKATLAVTLSNEQEFTDDIVRLAHELHQ
jgi:hypothetical protein